MSEPITVEEARRQVRLDDDSDDALLESLIVAAREHVEGITGLTLSRRQVTQAFDGFGRAMRLYAWPIVEDEPAVMSYRDAGGVAQPFTDFFIDADGQPAVVLPVFGRPWPVGGRVRVTVTAGYLPAEVPQVLKAAMLLVLAGLYESRGDLPEATEKSVRALCGQFKRWRV